MWGYINVKKMYDDMAQGMPKVVYCPKCGRQEDVEPVHCLANGWPKCCGFTMLLGENPTKREPET